MDFVDSALEKVVAANVSLEPHLHKYAKWLAFESPDRGPVKFGIALLGLIRDKNDMDKITALGKHEEFTLFSAVALTNTYENPEQELWNLAKFVDGWEKSTLSKDWARHKTLILKDGSFGKDTRIALCMNILLIRVLWLET
jgi:hypothetical protein